MKELEKIFINLYRIDFTVKFHDPIIKMRKNQPESLPENFF